MNDAERTLFNLDTYVNQIDAGAHEIKTGLDRIEIIKGELKGAARNLRDEYLSLPFPRVWHESLFKDSHYGEDEFSLLGPGFEKFPSIQKNLLISIAQNWVQYPMNDSKTPFTTSEDLRKQLPRFDIGSADQIAEILDALVTKMHAERNQPAAAAA